MELQQIGTQHPTIKRILDIQRNTAPNRDALFVAEGLWAHEAVLDAIRNETPDLREVVCVDAKKNAVEQHFPLAPGAEPTGLAIDAEHGTLFAACHNEMLVVLDAASGKVLATPKIGKRVDGAAFDPVSGLAFASNGDGTLSESNLSLTFSPSRPLEPPADPVNVCVNAAS